MENFRYERKMTTESSRLHDVLLLIKSHRALFRKQFPNRVINNIYFDTPSLTSYRDHVSGTARREKKRIRWYGSPEDIISNPVLERKIKIGMVGEKLIEPLTPLKVDLQGPWPIPGEALSEANTYLHTVHWRLRALQPVVAIRYERYYFVSSDYKYRLTVDKNLEYFGLSSKGKPQMRSLLPAPLIIELKYDREFANDADTISNEFPFRIDRFSKYIFAIEGLKVNN
jgi:hypothetical protein